MSGACDLQLPLSGGVAKPSVRFLVHLPGKTPLVTMAFPRHHFVSSSHFITSIRHHPCPCNPTGRGRDRDHPLRQGRLCSRSTAGGRDHRIPCRLGGRGGSAAAAQPVEGRPLAAAITLGGTPQDLHIQYGLIFINQNRIRICIYRSKREFKTIPSNRIL